MVAATLLPLSLAGTSCAAPPDPAPEPVAVDEQDPAQWSSEALPPAPEGGFTVSGTLASDPASGTESEADSQVAHDVEPGWYELVVSCAGTDDMTLDLHGPSTRFGTGYIPCQDTPITMVSYLGDTPYVAPEDVSVVASKASSTALWGVTASPTDAPG